MSVYTCFGNDFIVCYFIVLISVCVYMLRKWLYSFSFIISDFSQIFRLYINLKLYLFLVAYLPDGGLVQDAVMGNFFPN